MSQNDQITLYAGPSGLYFKKGIDGKMGAVIPSPALRKQLDKLCKEVADDLERKIGPVKTTTVKPTDSWDSSIGYRAGTYLEKAIRARNEHYRNDHRWGMMDGPRDFAPSGPGENPCCEIGIDGKPWGQCSLRGRFENQVTIE